MRQEYGCIGHVRNNRQSGCRGSLEKHLRQAEHIVSVTGFRTLYIIEHGCEIVRRMKMLTYAVAADTDGTVIDNCIPEKRAA